MSRFYFIFASLAGAFFTLLFILNAPVSAQEPLGSRCGEVGPLPDRSDYCGCTWGRVLFHGEPLQGITVTLTYANGSGNVTDRTVPEPFGSGITSNYIDDRFPYFSLSGYENGNGALLGDVVTASATVGGMVISRTFRALPDKDGLQQIDLTVPDAAWESYVGGEGYTRTLTISDNRLWAGGDAGVKTIDLDSETVTTYAVPTVYALANGVNGRVWAAGATGVYEFTNGTVQTHTTGIENPIKFIGTYTETVLIGNENKQLAVYAETPARDSWAVVPSPSASSFHSVAVDGEGNYWVGGGNGAFRYHEGVWKSFTTSDGVGANRILSAEATPIHLWAGTAPADNNSGGISLFDYATESWETFTETNGLIAELGFFGFVVDDVYDITFDEQGRGWAAVGNAVQFQPYPAQWGAYTTTHGLPDSPIHAVAVNGSHDSEAWAASADGLYRQNPAIIAGTPPTATIITATINADNLILKSTANDTDEDDTITAWEWLVLETGQPLCSTMTCTVTIELLDLPAGSFTVTLRVEDDEGMWSDTQTQSGLIYSPPTAVSISELSATPNRSLLFILPLILFGLPILLRKRHV